MWGFKANASKVDAANCPFATSISIEKWVSPALTWVKYTKFSSSNSSKSCFLANILARSAFPDVRRGVLNMN